MIVDNPMTEKHNLFLKVMLAPLLFFTIVMPNSFQIATAGIMCFWALISLWHLELKDLSLKFLFFFFLSLLVSLIYLLLGALNDAPSKALLQIPIIYIISPFIWFLIITVLLKNFTLDWIIDVFKATSLLCFISVFVFFYLFNTFGASAVSAFHENANVVMKGGQVAATMHVYGSLIFLSGAFFSAPEVIKNSFYRKLFLLLLLLAVLTSGRSALLMTLPIGLIINFTLSNKKINPSHIFPMFFMGLISIIFIYVISKYFSMDWEFMAKSLADKISSGGGSVRAEQSWALLDGVSANYALGAGHGIGVDYIRSIQHPWRYESVWIATFYRVGFIGALIYALPFLYYFFKSFKKIKDTGLTDCEKFIFGGFLCIFLASNTNPYIEAITFQWAFVLPVLSIINKTKSLNR